MYKIILILPLLLISANVLAIADQTQQVITLKDGSQIKGVLSGIENGVYTIKTPIIGDVHVAASDVANISNGSVPAPSLPVTASATNSTLDQQIASQQQRLIANPQAMADLQQIAQDPEIVQALSDPALIQAVTSHDYQAIQNNPKIQELMNTPKMQALLQKIAATQQQQQSTTTQ